MTQFVVLIIYTTISSFFVLLYYNWFDLATASKHVAAAQQQPAVITRLLIGHDAESRLTIESSIV